MPHSSRLASIDCIRGFAVLAMLLATYLFGTETVLAWLRHAPGRSLTAVDLKTSWHIFAVDENLLILFGGTP
jgi:predicted acyltransferase